MKLGIPAALAALIVAAAPAAVHAAGFQHVVGFEDPADLGGVELDNTLKTTFACAQGCDIVGDLPGYPVFEGSHQLLTTDFDIVVQNPVDISWPAMGAYVTGASTVYVTFYEWDYDPNVWSNVEVATFHTDGPNTTGSGHDPNVFLGFGSEIHPLALTRAHFYSDQPFTLDNVTIGLVNVGPGIPEPAEWALLLIGFGAIGAALRNRAEHGLRRLHNG